MSLKRLTEYERAVYLLGEAAIRQLKHAPRDPDTRREIAIFARWVEHWLDGDELHHIITRTGYTFGQLWDEVPTDSSQGVLDFPPKDGFSEDEIPF